MKMKVNFSIKSLLLLNRVLKIQNKKASNCFLSKELTTNDQQLKTQMMMLFKDDEGNKN